MVRPSNPCGRADPRGLDGFFCNCRRFGYYWKGLPHMNLTDVRLKELDNPALTDDERVVSLCRAAAELSHGGRHDDARKILGGLWRGVGERPNVEVLGESAT